MNLSRSRAAAVSAAVAATTLACHGAGGSEVGSGDEGPGGPARSGTAPDAASPETVAGDPLAAAGYDVEARMKALGIPGMSLAVFEEGRVVWAEGYGVVERGRSEKVTPGTRFQAASISKPVAALAILRLAEEGRLDLDGDVNRALESWRIPVNELTREEPVTLRRILAHRAGLTVHGFPGYRPGEALPELPEVLDGEGPANTGPVRVDILPGSTERYSGGGTTVAELLLEDVLGRPFPETMHELVLAPLGMDRSTYEQPLPEELEAGAARGHVAGGSPVEGGWHVYPERAAAGLWTTASDLARVAMEVHRSLEGREGALLSPAWAEAMVTPGAGAFALGFMVEGEGDGALFHHGGANRGFEGLLLAHRHERRGLAVLTNAEGGSLLAREVVAAVAEGRDWGESR